ncbi:E3 UFM1-protein ligase 1 [Patella vulgata]|uniref:E3 UFM1-protein ligase 1 n=1 Tax=Patella vulgata TaxID=6465 RepID=UPI00218068FF|nr:E3 UFM1-protein ligase 1 [Patella vulgata]
MADLEEVHRLQEKLRLVQLTATKQKLSERNVVEIVSKLVEFNLIDVVYTCDGKEYLTHDEISKEIKEELAVHGGRINLVELQEILNVDLNIIEVQVNKIIKQGTFSLILGQLIDKNYQNQLAEEVNDKLQEQGYVKIADIVRQYDLPFEFISKVVLSRLGSTIKGRVDKTDRDVIFTEAFVRRMKAKIRGAFSAITSPFTITAIQNLLGLQENLFMSILEDLVNSKRLEGTLMGSIFTPDIYTKSQNDWVDTFYHQNGYLEYASLHRLGISEVQQYIKQRFHQEDIVYLSSSCAGRVIQDLVEASVDEALSQDSWVDISTLLPSVFSSNDAYQLLTSYQKNHQGAFVCGRTVIASDKLISQCNKLFQDKVSKKAKKDALANPKMFNQEEDRRGKDNDDYIDVKEERREQRRKKAAAGSGSTKSGGGTQGREIKTKSTKKKGGRGRDADKGDSDDDSKQSKSSQPEIEFMSVQELSDVIREQPFLRDCPERLVKEISTQLYKPLTREYIEVASATLNEIVGTKSSVDRKKTHNELQEKITGLWTNLKLFEKGVKLFKDDSQVQLSKHLLSTVGNDICNIIANAVAADHQMAIEDETTLKHEDRYKLITQLPNKDQTPLLKLHLSVRGKNLDEFCTSFETLCGPEHLGLILKKIDKKKERQLTFSHRQSLVAQLKEEEDAAMCLHLASVILFYTFTQSILDAPGRLVPQILLFLADYMDKEKHQVLVNLQDLVIKDTKLRNNPEEGTEDLEGLQSDIKDLVPEVKEIAFTTRKSGNTNED